MSKTDDGHYELILGNRQLVSGFFVLIILFAIFLTLGYVLGRNSVVLDEPGSQLAQQQPLPAKPRSSEASSRPSASPSQSRPNAAGDSATPGSAGPSSTVPTASTTVTPAAQRSDRDEAVVVETRSADSPTKPAVQTPPSKAQQILDSRVRLITPRQGDTFVQVAAVAREDAELMAEQLQRRGYRTFISEVPGRDLFRVLIGPFESTAMLNETKGKLAQEGIETIVQRY